MEKLRATFGECQITIFLTNSEKLTSVKNQETQVYTDFLINFSQRENNSFKDDIQWKNRKGIRELEYDFSKLK